MLEASPSLDKAITIANALRVKLDYLVGYVTSPNPLSNAKLFLFSGFDELNDDGRNTLMILLSSLKKSHPEKNGGNNYVAIPSGNKYIAVSQ